MSPSQPQETKYVTPLTDVDRVATRFKVHLGQVTEFSVQYDALTEGRWRPVTRFDSAHSRPHRHIYQLNGKKYRVEFPYAELGTALNEAQQLIKQNFKVMRENYMLSRRGGV